MKNLPYFFTEEAVQEVKRQAMLELHKAVSAAESKANEMVLSERAKIDRALSEARKQTREELLNTFNRQEESSEVSRKSLKTQEQCLPSKQKSLICYYCYAICSDMSKAATLILIFRCAPAISL